MRHGLITSLHEHHGESDRRYGGGDEGEGPAESGDPAPSEIGAQEEGNRQAVRPRRSGVPEGGGEPGQTEAGLHRAVSEGGAHRTRREGAGGTRDPQGLSARGRDRRGDQGRSRQGG